MMSLGAHPQLARSSEGLTLPLLSLLIALALPPGMMSLALSWVGLGGATVLASFFGILLFDLAVAQRFRKSPPFPLLAMTLLALAYGSLAYGSNNSNTQAAATLFWTIPVLFVACQQVVSHSGNSLAAAERVVDAVSLSLLVTACIGLFQFFAGVKEVLGVPGLGMAGHKNPFGYLCALGFGIAISVSQEKTARGRIYKALVPFFGLAALLSMSRGAWLASAMAIVAVAALKKDVRQASLAALFLSALLVLAWFFPGVRARFSAEDVSSGRWDLWSVILPRAPSEILTGRGVGFMWDLNQYDISPHGGYVSESNAAIYAHNDFLFLLVELGLLAALAWLSVVIASFQASLQLSKALARQQGWSIAPVCVSACIVLMVGQMVDTVFFGSHLILKIVPLLGVAMLLSRQASPAAMTSPGRA